MPKYHNKKIENEHGKFDSKIEYMRYLYLLDLYKQGRIDALERQVEFELIPTQYVMVEKQLKRGVKIEKKVIERPVKYYADFVYYKAEGNGFIKIVEDVKGRRTKEYILKRKMMRYLLQQPLVEVTKATQEI